VVKISFRNADTSFKFPDRHKLSGFIEYLFIQENKKLQKINYVLCSDNYLLALNREFLGHDYFTDVITFDLSENKKGIIAEIYISIDRIKKNSVEYGTTARKELLRVIFHGALHLCGYKDKTKKEIAEMRQAEDKYLSAFDKT
jgi:probable rRNA maturation factor